MILRLGADEIGPAELDAVQAEVLRIIRCQACGGDDDAEISREQDRRTPKIDVEAAFHGPRVTKPAVGDALHLHLERYRRSPGRRQPAAELHAQALSRFAARGE